MYAATHRSNIASNEPHGALSKFAIIVQKSLQGLEFLAPVLDLAIRLLIASVFFKSGLTKITSWDSTLALFENEYAVPFLPPAIAALLGTAVELGFPILLVLGIGTRLSAFVLFVFNIIAVVSYPDLSEVGLKDHQYWGLLLLVTLFHGAGKLSLDHLLARHFGLNNSTTLPSTAGGKGVGGESAH